MNGFRFGISIIVVMAALLLIARPVIVFSSPAIQMTYLQEARAFGLIKAIRKRKERIPVIEIFRNEDRQSLFIAPLSTLLLLVRKWLSAVLLLIASIYHYFRRIKGRRTVFEITPTSDHYLSLSLLRI